jgi:hypothetical protein
MIYGYEGMTEKDQDLANTVSKLQSLLIEGYGVDISSILVKKVTLLDHLKFNTVRTPYGGVSFYHREHYHKRLHTIISEAVTDVLIKDLK